LIRISTNGDDRGDFVGEKLIHVLRVMAADVDTDFFHRLN
jgi:hypothetical protein